MKFEKAYNYILEEAKIDLIYENVYANEIFDPLIDFIVYNVEHFPFYVKLTYEKLNELIQVKWKLKKHLNKDKTVYVCYSDELNKVSELNLSDDDIQEIINRLRSDDGVFVYDLIQDKNRSLIVINECLEYSEFKKTIFHEIIHFLQWNTGRKVHDILNEMGLDISEEDIKEISDAMHLDQTVIEDLLNYYFCPEEREAYYKDIFDECIKVLDINGGRHRKTFKWFIQMFRNDDCMSFKQYFEKMVENVDHFGLDTDIFRNREMKLLLIYRLF